MINRIIVGVDFSDPSLTALKRAAAWALMLERPLVVVHILKSPTPMVPESHIPFLDPASLDAIETHTRDRLRQFAQAIPGCALVVKWGSPAEELMAMADPESLLVVGQVGYSRMEHLFGSTASRVVQRAPCNVLVVRRERPARRA